jgi:hypothetical protein
MYVHIDMYVRMYYQHWLNTIHEVGREKEVHMYVLTSQEYICTQYTALKTKWLTTQSVSSTPHTGEHG